MQQVVSPEPRRELLRLRVCGLFRYAFNVVPAKAGTHTPRPLVCSMMLDGNRFNERLWLWVLTFVRTTRAQPNDQSTDVISAIVE